MTGNASIRWLEGEAGKMPAFQKRFEWGGDFGAPDETYLSNQHGKPVFVHHFPAAIKGFYFEVDKDRPECALGIDLLAPEGYGEIIGGGERAASLDYLDEQLKTPRPAAGDLRMVSRPPPLRQRPARRLRHGHRTLHRLDGRHRTRSRNYPVSEDVVPVQALIHAQRDHHRRSQRSG